MAGKVDGRPCSFPLRRNADWPERSAVCLAETERMVAAELAVAAAGRFPHVGVRRPLDRKWKSRQAAVSNRSEYSTCSMTPQNANAAGWLCAGPIVPWRPSNLSEIRGVATLRPQLI